MNVHDVRDWLWLTVALMSWVATWLAISLRRALRPHLTTLAELAAISEERTARIEATHAATRVSNELKRQSDDRLREELRIVREENQRVREANRSVLAELMRVTKELRLRYPTSPNHQPNRSES